MLRHDTFLSACLTSDTLSPYLVQSQARAPDQRLRRRQETFRVERVEGRLVLDVLRHALTACSLASFSLADCAQSLLVRVLG